MSDYRVLPVPPGFRGPSDEPYQIQVDGLVKKVSLFHGRADEEFDWHIYLCMAARTAQRIGQFLRQNDTPISDGGVSHLYSELMVVDDRHRRSITWPPWQASFQWRYDSADLTRVLRLVKPGSDHPAYDLARPVADEPGDNVDLTESSRLFSDYGRVYIQGLLVLDVAHPPGRLEIHPPDSIAFAMDDHGQTLSATAGSADWPARSVRWRVAWVTNSARHRINDVAVEGEEPLKQERTTTWYLPLPGPVPDTRLPQPEPVPLPQRVDIVTEPQTLWDSKEDEWYDRRGVAAIEDARLAVDPRDNRRKLRVSATMSVPGSRGGLVVRDYVVRLRPDVVVDAGPDN